MTTRAPSSTLFGMATALSTAQLSRELAAEWSTIQSVWPDCVEFFTAAGLSAAEAQSLAMTTQELLENAVKYGQFASHQRIELNLATAGTEATIEVRSPAAPGANLRELDDTIQWIRGFQNPFEAYVERMKRLISAQYDPAVSGLGLVRIAYEAQCVLDFYVDQQDRVTLSAVYRTDPRRGEPTPP